jgi:hypothetical protein
MGQADPAGSLDADGGIARGRSAQREGAAEEALAVVIEADQKGLAELARAVGDLTGSRARSSSAAPRPAGSQTTLAQMWMP